MIKRFNYRPLVVAAFLLLLWQWALGYHHVVSDTLAPPSAVVMAVIGLIADGTVIKATAETLSTTLLGLLFGGAIGTAIGLFGGMSRPVATAIHGPVEVLRPLPAIALVPLFTITFGLGLAMEVYVVTFAVVWPCIILAQTAVRNVDARLLEVADVLELNRFSTIWKIILPAVGPRLVVMVRFSGAIALLIAVTVELVSNPWGLGHGMMVASEGFRPAMMLAYLVIITAVGWCLNWIFEAAERHLSPARTSRS